jgi:O-antigen/teichoic acid export membrane protein
MAERFSEDIAKYTPSHIVPAIIGILSVPIFTRLFLPADYGIYILVLTTVSILTTVGTSWIDNAILRFFPIHKERGEVKLFHTNVLFLTLFSVITIGVLFLVASYLITISSLFRLGVLLFIVSALSSVGLYLLQAKRAATKYSIFSVWRSVLGFLLALTLIFALKSGVAALILGPILASAIALPWLWKFAFAGGFESNFHKNEALKMIKYGVPTTFSNIASWGLIFSDRYFIKFYLGSGAVGVYSAGYALAERSGMLIIALFMLAALPIAFNTWETKGVDETKKFIVGLTKKYMLFSIPLVLIITALAKPLLTIFTGQGYWAGYKIVPYVSLSALFFGFHRIVATGLLIHKKTNILMFNTLITFFLNVILNFIFIPKYGYIAASITTLVSYFMLLVLTIVTSSKYLPWIFPYSSFFKILLSSAIAGISTHYLVRIMRSPIPQFLIGGVAGVIVYFLVIFLLGGKGDKFIPQVFSRR